MTVVAEGVETLQELNFLKKMGCDIIQGYYYSKPLPYTQFLSFVEQTGFSSLKSKFI
jgi:EAL domain-containing protein (putative c-di-GMP-specific phosphodiesterase class I)